MVDFNKLKKKNEIDDQSVSQSVSQSVKGTA